MAEPFSPLAHAFPPDLVRAVAQDAARDADHVGGFLSALGPLEQWLGHHAPLMTFFPAIILSAYLGGLGPGLLATCDGAYRWFKTRGVPVRDGGGNIVKWFGTCT